MSDDLGFDYFITKDEKVFIEHYGKRVTILKGKQAQKFIASAEDASEAEIQLMLAKLTGNYKRGNEREGKKTPKML